MRKTYRLQNLGGSIYICFHSSFFTNKMLKDKEVRVELIEKGGDYAIVRLGEINAEHDISVEADREDASESRITADVRKAGGHE
ncbi:MAG: hypothetical protein HWN68_20285 [Desulfobacterales bacterium]|nr:hypothetical protein [Desulfobacterales bacterium]